MGIVRVIHSSSHSKHCIGIIVCHNHLCAIFAQMASNACLNPVRGKNGLLGDTPGLHPADVYLPDLWGSPAAVDFAITCPLQPRYKNCEEPAEQYAITQKHKKYDSGFEKTNITFIAAVADSFGGWTKEGEEVIIEVARRGARRLLEVVSMYVAHCWTKLSISLQTDIACMMLSRIPLPSSNDNWV